jgi:hypothetical protein
MCVMLTRAKKTKNKFGLEQRDSVLNTLDFASPF